MKKIVVMPVKNEAWILEKSLATASLWADHIVVADQLSTDETPRICKRFSKVVYVENSSEKFNEAARRQLLLDTARSFDGQNLIFALDADEVLSANVLGGHDLENVVSRMQPGMAAEFEWINLWKSPLAYRSDDSVWSGSYKHFMYWDDRKVSFKNGLIHLSRVPEECVAYSVRSETLKVLHYQFVVWSRMLAKQRYYRVLEKIMHPEKSFLAINHRYFASKDVSSVTTVPVPAAWIQTYEERGIDMQACVEEAVYWYDREVLRLLAVHGAEYFKQLDIWDTDWEEKRQVVSRIKESVVPAQPLVDPRGFSTKLYHRFLQRPLEQALVVKNWFKKLP